MTMTTMMFWRSEKEKHMPLRSEARQEGVRPSGGALTGIKDPHPGRPMEMRPYRRMPTSPVRGQCPPDPPTATACTTMTKTTMMFLGVVQ